MSLAADLLKEYRLIWKLKFEKDGLPGEWTKGKRGDVILIPGLRSDWHSLKIIGNFVNYLGYRVHILSDLDKNTGSVESGVKIVEGYLKQLKLRKIILITHSKGGVIAKCLLDYSPEGKKIKKIIAIAAPFKGSIWAKIKWLGASELATGSEVINKICRNKENNHKIVSIFPSFDNHVMPGGNSRLEGANNIEVDIVGHTRVLFSAEVLSIISKCLGMERRQRRKKDDGG